LRIHPRQVRIFVILIGFTLAGYYFYKKLNATPAVSNPPAHAARLADLTTRSC